MLQVSVTDEGPGIPQSDLDRATERFFRGETARSTPGFGLGLTLVRAVAQLHGGSLGLLPGAPGLRAVLSIPVMGEAEREDGSLRRQALPAPSEHEHVAVGRSGAI